ncbi:MAG: NAD(+)/NADH kinase [Acidobacteriota bacterium]
MKLGIVVKSRTDFAARLQELLGWLKERDCEPLLDESTDRTFDFSGFASLPREELPEKADAIVVFGGDGTFLSVARTIQDQSTPILGVNLGSLGFLTEVTLTELYPALESFLRGDYRLETRCMLMAEVRQLTGEVTIYHALNDVVINKGTLARIITMEAYVGEDFVALYLADGIIIATPTGSTAYSLSAGGPIVFPTLDAVIMTPICPHTLTNRAVVIPANSDIRIKLKSGEDVMLTIDGQVGVGLKEGDEVICSRSSHTVRLIKPTGKHFFNVLREKLKWGQR